tara:strand:- start:46 stop:573 length:528 start_codon:yes stop_codon:yes gene_type:complete
MNKTNLFKILLIGLISMSLGIGLKKYFYKNEASNNDLPTKILFNTSLPDNYENIVSLSDYKKKWILINFWATWCEPCREEIPELNEFYENNKNITLIGIAIDEPELVRKYTKIVPIHYTSLISDMSGVSLSKSLGNDRGVLPFSVLIDPSGEIKSTFTGKLTSNDLTEIIPSMVR